MSKEPYFKITCDRPGCGHQETIEDPFQEQGWGKIFVKQNSGDKRISRTGPELVRQGGGTGTSHPSEGPVDICPKCVEEVYEWWKTPQG